MSAVALLGLGVMGQGMAVNLAAAGHTVRAWTRSGMAEVPDRVRTSVIACTSPAEAVAEAEFVLYCLSDDAAVVDLLFGEHRLVDAIPQQAIAIDLSTIDPETTAQEAAALRERGIAFLDAPVFGTRGEAMAGGLWIVVGGDPAVLDRARTVLEPLSATIHYMGPTGSGTSMKLVGNLLVASQLQSLAEALVLASKAGLDLDRVLDVVEVTDFRTPIYSGVGRAARRGDYSVNFSLDLLLKDATLISGFADRLAAPIPMTAVIREQVAAAVADGMGALNASAVVKAHAERNGVDLRARLADGGDLPGDAGGEAAGS